MQRVSDSKIEDAKKMKEYFKNMAEAADFRADVQKLLHGTGDEPSPQIESAYERVKKATVEGMEIRAFKDAIGENAMVQEITNPNEQSIKGGQKSESLTRIAETLAKAGKKPEEVDEYLRKIAPHLELAGLAGEGGSQLMLYNLLRENPGSPSFKEVLEAVKMVTETKGPVSSGSDPTEMAKVMVDMFKTGVQVAGKENPGGSPFEAYSKGIEFAKTFADQMSAKDRAYFEDKIKRLEESAHSQDPVEYVKKMKETMDALGMGGVDKEIQLRKIELDHDSQRHDWELEKEDRKLQREEKLEATKANRQTKMIDRIATAIERGLESPVVKEAGKAAGEKLGVKVPDIRGKAAREQLANPMQEQSFLTCTGCGKEHAFTNADLVKIEQAGGRWMCTTPGCGKAFQLKAGGVAKT